MAYKIKIFSHPLHGILHCTLLRLSEKISTVYEQRSQTSSSTQPQDVKTCLYCIHRM